jgi:hypothetical protein
MMKNRRTIKSAFIIGLVLVSACAAFVPSTSAGIFFNLQSVVSVGYSGNKTEDPVVPRGSIITVQMDVDYYVTRGVLGKGVLLAYQGKNAFVKLEIVGQSSWLTANLMKDTVPFSISDQKQTSTFNVAFQASENAPAYAQGYITIKASVGKLGLIEGFEQEFTLPVFPAYKPLIDPSLPDTNTKRIGPMDTAVFPIEVRNLGNAETIVFLDVEYVPKGWNAIITSQVTLSEGDGSTATAYLVVKPPKSFGYHSEEETIRISMEPVRADDQKDRGEKIYENFLVESQGFSTHGIEAVLPIILVIIVVLLIAIYYFKTKNKK